MAARVSLRATNQVLWPPPTLAKARIGSSPASHSRCGRYRKARQQALCERSISPRLSVCTSFPASNGSSKHICRQGRERTVAALSTHRTSGFVDEAELQSSKEREVPISRFWALLAPDWLLLLCCLTCLTAYAVIWVRIPSIFAAVFDAMKIGSGASDVPRMKTAVILLAVAFFTSSILSASQMALASMAAERFSARLKKRLFSAILSQEMSFFDANSKGELVSRLTVDIGVAQTSLQEVIGSRGLRTLFEVVGSLMTMLITNWKLAIILIALSPLLVWSTRTISAISSRLSKEEQNALAKCLELANEQLSNVRTIITFVQEENEIRRFKDYLDVTYRVGKRAALAQGAMQAISRSGLKAGTLVLFGYGGLLVGAGKLSVGTLMSYSILNSMVVSGTAILLASIGSVARAQGALQRVLKLLDLEPCSRSTSGTLQLPSIRGEVELRNVWFQYSTAQAGQWALRHVNLRAAPGSVIALVGPSGGGKSTVAALLLRLYEPTSGQILLDKTPMTELDPGWLRSQVAVVSQEATLFSGTLRDNIAYARPNAPQKAVEAAARAANAHDFIVALPNGYDTEVGERGALLSGGQRQRIAIARALLKNSPILVLDEATSALDVGSEALVAAALKQLMRGRTTLLIAHRLSTVRNADQIVVLDRGCVREAGSHDYLARLEGGLYRRMLKLVESSEEASVREMEELFDSAAGRIVEQKGAAKPLRTSSAHHKPSQV